MNVLILADHFPPSFAPRMGYLTRNLKSLGHSVYVVAITKHRDFNSFDFLSGYADEVYTVASRERSHKQVLLSLIKGFFSSFRFMWSDVDSEYFTCCKALLSTHHIDCMICSTSSFYPLMVAERLMSSLPSILDFRDIYEQDETFYPRRGLAGVMRHFQKKIRTRIVRKANAVVSVSNWHCSYLSKWNSNCHLILNGFDERRFSPQPAWHGDKVRIVYTGTLATPSGDISAHTPDMLFEAIDELPADKRSRLDVVFYTDSNSISIMNRVIEKYHLTDVVRCSEWVKSDMVPDILKESSALLILSNHGNKGVMLTKSFEYMAMNRPIICLPNPDSQLEAIIVETGTGVVLRDKHSVVRTLESLIEGSLSVHRNEETIMCFSRMSQAQQFVDLMSYIMHK